VVSTTNEAVDPVAVQPFVSVTVTVYIPAEAGTTLLTEGVGRLLINPLGPVQLYIYGAAPRDGVAVRLIFPPVQNEVLLAVAETDGD
jgi:hypothetical protein